MSQIAGIEPLVNYLQQTEALGESADWQGGLSARKLAELEFHNRDRDRQLVAQLPKDTFELLHGNKKFYSTVALSQKYIESWLAREVSGKAFLDYACGNGFHAVRAAKFGAALAVGMDISDVSVRNARESAAEQGVGANCRFVQGDCENTGFPENSFDVILCSGMLHHLDLSYALPELRRILKPGGKILAVEALNYNPLIKLYRALTPSMRTEWERNHILSLADLKFAERFFALGEVRYWHLFSISAAFLSGSPRLQGLLLGLFNFVDGMWMKIPLLNLMAWQFTFELIKRRES